MKTNNKINIFFGLALTFCGLNSTASAQGPVIQTSSGHNTAIDGITVSNVSMQRVGDKLDVSMIMNLTDVTMTGDRVILYNPFIVNGSDTLALTPVGLYSRTRWIQYSRRDGKPTVGTLREIAYRFNERPEVVNYSESVPYQGWMNGAELIVKRDDYGCCKKLLAAYDGVDVGNWREIAFMPSIKYARPVAGGVKTRSIEGTAFIDFPVDQTIIYDTYRNNAFELDSIRKTIDVVRNDPDATIKTVWLKGFASPESPYKHNTDLAKGRTAALKNYIGNLYDFSGINIITDYEPEDWEGLRKAVSESNLEHKYEIINLIDTPMDPDVKEARIKALYPSEYKYMLQNFYPPLRHTNYRVEYMVRSYTDPYEILEIMRSKPKNLDLDEFYTAASVLEPGSEDFNDVFETAVKLYPADATANLNAANAALQRQDLVSAKKYLAKAGDSADADYARAILASFNGNYDDAVKYLNAAKKAGLEISKEELDNIEDFLDYATKYENK